MGSKNNRRNSKNVNVKSDSSNVDVKSESSNVDVKNESTVIDAPVESVKINEPAASNAATMFIDNLLDSTKIDETPMMVVESVKIDAPAKIDGSTVLDELISRVDAKNAPTKIDMVDSRRNDVSTARLMKLNVSKRGKVYTCKRTGVSLTSLNVLAFSAILLAEKGNRPMTISRDRLVAIFECTSPNKRVFANNTTPQRTCIEGYRSGFTHFLVNGDAYDFIIVDEKGASKKVNGVYDLSRVWSAFDTLLSAVLVDIHEYNSKRSTDFDWSWVNLVSID